MQSHIGFCTQMPHTVTKPENKILTQRTYKVKKKRKVLQPFVKSKVNLGLCTQTPDSKRLFQQGSYALHQRCLPKVKASSQSNVKTLKIVLKASVCSVASVELLSSAWVVVVYRVTQPGVSIQAELSKVRMNWELWCRMIKQCAREWSWKELYLGVQGKQVCIPVLAPLLEPRFTSLKGSEMPGQRLIKGLSGHFVQIDQWGQRHQVEYIFESSGGLHLVFLLINTLVI